MISHQTSGSHLATRGGVEDIRLEAKDTKKIRGQGQGQPFRKQTLSRPRPRTKDTSACALQKKGLHKNFSGDLQKKKRSSQKFFKRSPQKNVFQKIFPAIHKILTIQKILLSSSRGQANFRGLEASRPRTSKCVLEDSTSVSYKPTKQQKGSKLKRYCSRSVLLKENCLRFQRFALNLVSLFP